VYLLGLFSTDTHTSSRFCRAGGFVCQGTCCSILANRAEAEKWRSGDFTAVLVQIAVRYMKLFQYKTENTRKKIPTTNLSQIYDQKVGSFS